jgi:hypothetical protein
LLPPSQESTSQPDAAKAGGDPEKPTPVESREEKKMRLAKERAAKKEQANLKKAQKEAEKQQKKLKEREEMIRLGKDAEELDREEAEKREIAAATAQSRRYSTISLLALAPLNGVTKGDEAWLAFKDSAFVQALAFNPLVHAAAPTASVPAATPTGPCLDSHPNSDCRVRPRSSFCLDSKRASDRCYGQHDLCFPFGRSSAGTLEDHPVMKSLKENYESMMAHLSENPHVQKGTVKSLAWCKKNMTSDNYNACLKGLQDLKQQLDVIEKHASSINEMREAAEQSQAI